MIDVFTSADLLDFPRDSDMRRELQPEGARRHPGKMHLGFLSWLLTRYTRPGDVLLDPMAGSGSLLVATLKPWCCDVVLNELEPHWCEQIEASWQRMQSLLVQPIGSADVLRGDARKLSGLIDLVSTVLTSPPYDNVLSSIRHAGNHEREYEIGSKGGAPSRSALRSGYDAVVTSPPYGDALGIGEVGEGLKEYLETDPRAGRSSLLHRPVYYEKNTPPERNPAQIGNFAGKRYSAAMREVYAETVKVLKLGGLMILVIKNIVRKNKEVDLVGEAVEMCADLGMVQQDIHYRRVAVGPFHAIRRRQNADCLIIDREAAIVLRKPL